MPSITLTVGPWNILGAQAVPSYERCVWEPYKFLTAGRISDHGNGHVYWMTSTPAGTWIKRGEEPTRDLAIQAANLSLQEYCDSMKQE